MRTNDLIQAMRLAARSLSDDNSLAEAVILEESAERLTVLANRLRRAGLSAEEAEVDKGRKPPTEPIGDVHGNRYDDDSYDDDTRKP